MMMRHADTYEYGVDEGFIQPYDEMPLTRCYPANRLWRWLGAVQPPVQSTRGGPTYRATAGAVRKKIRGQSR